MNQTLRVLIVDDEASQRAGLAGMVTAWGMLADTASDGVEALEKLAKVPVDVILTDLNMPGMDGFELLDKLRSMGDRPPSIVLTAYGSMVSAIKTVHELAPSGSSSSRYMPTRWPCAALVRSCRHGFRRRRSSGEIGQSSSGCDPDRSQHARNGWFRAARQAAQHG